MQTVKQASNFGIQEDSNSSACWGGKRHIQRNYKVFGLLGDFTIVKFPYNTTFKGDKLYQSLQLYDDFKSSDPKVEICYYASSILDINFFRTKFLNG